MKGGAERNTNHDGEWGDVHHRPEEDAEGSDDEGAAVVRVSKGEDEDRHRHDEGDLDQQYDEHPQPRPPLRVQEEEQHVGELYYEPRPVDGDDQNAVGVHPRQPVHHPQHAVEEGGQVRYGRELLHRFLLAYCDEGRPVDPQRQIERERERASVVRSRETQSSPAGEGRRSAMVLTRETRTAPAL